MSKKSEAAARDTASFWRYLIMQSVSIVLLAVIVGVAFNYVRPGSLPLETDLSGMRPAPADAGALAISLEEAEVLYFVQAAVFLDTRSQELFRLGHVQGAVNLPWEDFDKRFPQLATEVPFNIMIIAYCDGTSCDSSRQLALALRERGYMNVRVLENGWTLWQQAGLPVSQ